MKTEKMIAEDYIQDSIEKTLWGDYQGAIKDTVKAIELTTDANEKAGRYYYIGGTEEECGNYDKAIVAYTKAIELTTSERWKKEYSTALEQAKEEQKIFQRLGMLK